MKLRNLCLLIALAATITPQTQSYMSRSTRTLLCASGALAFAVPTWWAHKKVKALDALSDDKKSKPETKEALARWKLVRSLCGSVSAGLAASTVDNVCHIIKKYQEDQIADPIADQMRADQKKIRDAQQAAEDREHAAAREKLAAFNKARETREREEKEEQDRLKQQQEAEKARIAAMSPEERAQWDQKEERRQGELAFERWNLMKLKRYAQAVAAVAANPAR